MSAAIFMVIHPTLLEKFHSEPQTCWWCYMKSQEITKFIRLHPLATMNICAKFHAIPSSNCCDSLNQIGALTDQYCCQLHQLQVCDGTQIQSVHIKALHTCSPPQPPRADFPTSPLHKIGVVQYQHYSCYTWQCKHIQAPVLNLQENMKSSGHRLLHNLN